MDEKSEKIEIEEANIQELPILNDEEKKDPVKVNWAIYERLGIMDGNFKVSMRVAKIAGTKADEAYKIACEARDEMADVKKSASRIGKALAWVGSALVGLALIWQSIKEIFHLK